MSTTIGRLLIELAANSAQFESDFSRAAKRAAAEAARIQRELERIGKQGTAGALQANIGLAALGKEASVTAGKLVSLNSIVGVLGASFGAWQLYDFARSVVETTNKFIGFEQALIAVTGSQDQANTELNYAREVAERLGLEITTVTKQYTALVAASRGSKLEGQGVRDIFVAISEASRVLNMSVYDTEGALRAVQQMISKGNVQAEELRGQLGERLYGAFLLAAEAMGVTQAELNDLLKQGKVAAEDLLPKFAVELRKVYQAQAEVASNMPAAEFNRLSIAITDLKRELGSGDFMQALVDVAKDLTKVIKDLNASGAIRRFSDDLGSLIRSIDDILIALGIFVGLKGIGGVISIVGKISGSAMLAAKGMSVLAGSITAMNAIATGAIATLGRLNIVAGALAVTYLSFKNIEEKWTPTFAADAIKEALPVINDFRTSINAANEDMRSASLEELSAKYAAFREQVAKLSQAYTALQSQAGAGSGTSEGRRRLAELAFLREKIIETEKAASSLLPLLEAISAGPPVSLKVPKEELQALSEQELNKYRRAVEELEELVAKNGTELEKLEKQYADDLKTIDKVAKAYGKMPGVMELVAKATDSVQLAFFEKKKELTSLIPLQKEYTALLSDVDPYFRQAAALRDNLVQLQRVEDAWRQAGLDTMKLQQIREGLLRSYEEETKELRRREDPVNGLIDDLKEELRLAKLNNIERQRAIALRGLEANATAEQRAEIERLLTSIEREANRGTFGGYVDSTGVGRALESMVDVLGAALEDALTNAGRGFMNVMREGLREMFKDFKSFAKGFKDIAGFAADTVQAFRNNPDAPLRALGESLSQLPGVVGDIAQAVMAIDSIFGGRLLGTNYEVDRTGRNISLGQGGFSGSTFTRESRQRSLFRGRAFRTTTEQLTQEAQNQLKQIFDAIREAMRQSAQALSVEVPAFITGAFEEIVDKNGKVIKQISTVLGRQYTETFEQFTKRLTAENIIAVIEQALAGSGEASNIAERFRSNADDLLAAAKAMLQAQEAIQRGQGLLGTGVSLSDTIALVEELALSGEDLDEAFRRVYGSTTLLEEAVSLTNVSLDLTREEFVRFAADITNAAGGLERATQLWNAYFETFYTEVERAQFRLDQALANRDTQLADIGLSSDVTPAEFREIFEQLLPSLSADAVVEWLEAAEAIGAVIDLEEALTEARQESLGQYQEFMQGIRDALFEDEASDYAIAIRDINREFQENVAQANELARAAGLQGASEEDLAAIHELAARRAAAAIRALRRSAQSLVNELYGSPEDRLNQQIEILESRYSAESQMIDDLQNQARERYEQELEALKRINDFLTEIMFSNVSPLTPRERLDEASRIYDELVARADAGDVDAISQLQEASQRYIEEARAYFGSSQEFVDIFNSVVRRLRGFVDAGPQSDPGSTGGGPGGSSELQELYRQRDELLAQQTAENRLLLAMDLAEHIRQLADALGESVFSVSESLGIDLDALMEDLGINLSDMTEETFARIADVANMLGVELSDLGEALGIDLGELGDINSVMSQSFLEEIATLPQEIRERLSAAFDDLTTAVLSGGDTTDALEFLQEIVDALPIEFRDQLAPFFDDIDAAPDPALSWLEQIQGSNLAIYSSNQAQADSLSRISSTVESILAAIRPPPQDPPPPPPPPEPEFVEPPKSSYNSPIAQVQIGEMVTEIKNLRNEMRTISDAHVRAITKQTEEIKRR